MSKSTWLKDNLSEELDGSLRINAFIVKADITYWCAFVSMYILTKQLLCEAFKLIHELMPIPEKYMKGSLLNQNQIKKVSQSNQSILCSPKKC